MFPASSVLCKQGPAGRGRFTSRWPASTVLPIHPYSHIVDEDLFDPLDGGAADAALPRRPRAARGAREVRLTPRRRGWPFVVAAFLLVALLAGMQLRGHGYKTRILHRLFPHAAAWMR